MSESEFDLYLSLLGKFLNLKPEQREEIADELRDHLEERLGELTQAGYEREQAIQKALEEFGDANALASHFTSLSQRRTRRRIMRWTVGSVTMLSLGLVLANAFWPQVPDAPGNGNAVAQDPLGGAGTPLNPHLVQEPLENKRTKLVNLTDKKQSIQQKLSVEMDVTFQDVPLSEVLETIAQLIQVDILIDRKSLEEEGIVPDESVVTLKFAFTKVAAKTALELVLDQHDLIYTIREGFIIVQTPAELETQMTSEVYPCKDLVVTLPVKPVGVGSPLSGNPYPGGGSGFVPNYGSERKKSNDGFPGTSSGYAPNDDSGSYLPPSKKNNTKSKPSKGNGGYPESEGALNSQPGNAPPAVGSLAVLQNQGLEPVLLQMGDGRFFGGEMSKPHPTLSPQEIAFLEVIQSAINPDTWEQVGGNSTIQLYQGMLIVRTTPDVHMDIQTLLEKMRTIHTPNPAKQSVPAKVRR